MKKSSVLILLAMFLIFSSVVVAQDEEEEEQWRNFEVGMNIGLTTSSNIDWYDSLKAKTGANYGAHGGMYISEDFCLGAYFTYAQMSPEELVGFSIADLKYKMYKVGLYGKYAFSGESNFEPYIKVSAGINFAKFATWVGPTVASRTTLREISYDPAFSGAATLGISYYTSDYGALFLEASYHLDKLKNTPAEHGQIIFPFPEDLTYIEIKAGIVVFFGPE